MLTPIFIITPIFKEGNTGCREAARLARALPTTKQQVWDLNAVRCYPLSQRPEPEQTQPEGLLQKSAVRPGMQQGFPRSPDVSSHFV